LLVDPRAVLPGLERTDWRAQDRCARRAGRGWITAEDDQVEGGDGNAVLRIFPNISDIPAGTKIMPGNFSEYFCWRENMVRRQHYSAAGVQIFRVGGLGELSNIPVGV
jgi:hypothetical protein